MTVLKSFLEGLVFVLGMGIGGGMLILVCIMIGNVIDFRERNKKKAV